jgi:hypothetical protein
VTDYADLARLGHVTRARVTQIMNLLNLAPDIQEELVFLPKTIRGRDPHPRAAPPPHRRRPQLAQAAADVEAPPGRAEGCEATGPRQVEQPPRYGTPNAGAGLKARGLIRFRVHQAFWWRFGAA